jgi:hypoxanthine-DNA glycosylase
MCDASVSSGFAPISNRHIRTLILGSLPSRRSIASGQYYGHPRNAFWPLMAELLEIRPGASYRARTDALLDARIGLWDVLRSSRRPGSLDANIDLQSARPNDFAGFFAAHPDLGRICFNGRKSAELFRRLVQLPDDGSTRRPEFVDLPSTSPAHAAMPFAAKLERWSIVIEPAKTVR